MKIWIFVWIAEFIILFFLSAVYSIKRLGGKGSLLYKNEKEDDIRILSGLPYENKRGHQYDLYLPAAARGQKISTRVILYIHGGSYNSGVKEEGKDWCCFYASQGYVTASLDYSLHKHGYDTNLNEMYQEVHSCVKAMKEKLAGLAGDGSLPHMDSLALCGCSAGGTLALGYGAKHGKDAPIPIRNVFTLVAPVDFEPKYWRLLKWVDKVKTDEEFLTLMTGHKISSDMMQSKEYEKYVDEISPARMISENMQGIHIVIGYGLKDHCVPAGQKELLMKALEENNIPYTYFPFPDCNHGMYRNQEVHRQFMEAVLKSLKEG